MGGFARDYSNPILEGMLTGATIAQHIRQAAADQAQLEHVKNVDEQNRQNQIQQQEQYKDLKARRGLEDAWTEFGNRMKLSQMGARQPTPQDVTEATAPRFSMDESGALSPIGTGTDIRDRILNYPGGGQMVMPSLQERIESAKTLSDADALAKASGTDIVRRKLNAPAGADIGGFMGIPSDTPLTMPERTAAMGLLPKFQPKDQTPHYETNDAGDVTLIQGGKTVATFPKAGKSKGAAGGEGDTAQQRLQFQKDQARQKELDQADTAEFGNLKDPGLHERRLELGQDLVNPPPDKLTGKPVPANVTLGKLSALNDQLRGIYKNKLKLRAITQEQYNQYAAALDKSDAWIKGKKQKPDFVLPTASPMPAPTTSIGTPLTTPGAAVPVPVTPGPAFAVPPNPYRPTQ